MLPLSRHEDRAHDDRAVAGHDSQPGRAGDDADQIPGRRADAAQRLLRAQRGVAVGRHRNGCGHQRAAVRRQTRTARSSRRNRFQPRFRVAGSHRPHARRRRARARAGSDRHRPRPAEEAIHQHGGDQPDPRRDRADARVLRGARHRSECAACRLRAPVLRRRGASVCTQHRADPRHAPPARRVEASGPAVDVRRLDLRERDRLAGLRRAVDDERGRLFLHGRPLLHSHRAQRRHPSLCPAYRSLPAQEHRARRARGIPHQRAAPRLQRLLQRLSERAQGALRPAADGCGSWCAAVRPSRHAARHRPCRTHWRRDSISSADA